MLGRALRMGGNSLERPPGWAAEGPQIPEGRGDWMAGGEEQKEDLDIKGLGMVAKMAPTLHVSSPHSPFFTKCGFASRGGISHTLKMAGPAACVAQHNAREMMV